MSPTSCPAATSAWPKAYPRHRGPWTLQGHDGEWGVFDPDTGEASTVEPAEDPSLPALRTALERGTLIGYRVGRRAVVATPNSYVKVVRPKRLDALVATHQWFDDTCEMVDTPTVTRTEPEGSVELTIVAGTSLHQLLRDHGPERLPLAAVDSIAASLAVLHSTPAPNHLPSRADDDPGRWVDTIARIDPQAAGVLATAATALPPLPDRPVTMTHGDLHDKNIFHQAGSVGLIDLDSVGLGAPEDDVANLAVHLQLRVLQGVRPQASGERLVTRLYESYRAHRSLDPERIEAAAARTWFRLACIYRFRMASRHLVPELLRRADQATPDHGR